MSRHFLNEFIKLWVARNYYLERVDEGGYTVYVPSLPGCISEGETKEEAMANIKEAIELYLEPVEDDLTLSPDHEILEIAV